MWLRIAFSVFLFVSIGCAQTPAEGAASFAARCSVCHGDDGKGTERAPGIVSVLDRATDAQLSAIIRDGIEGGMPAQDVPDAEMATLIAHLRSMQKPVATALALSIQTNWEALLAEFEPQLKAEFPTNESYRRDIRVHCTVDVTGDGVDEALVTLGYGGAYTDVQTLLRLENNVPVAAWYRQSDGRESPVTLTHGFSAMNHVAFKLDPENRAITQIHCTAALNTNPNVSETAACKADSYVWNDQAKLFEYDGLLSERIRAEYFQQRREQETSDDLPPPNQSRGIGACGQGSVSISPGRP